MPVGTTIWAVATITNSESRRLVIVAGAGASRKLGKEEDMPLMTDWARLLVSDLEQAVPGAAAAIGLRQDMDGEQFEEALGTFLRWQQVFHLTERFQRLGGPQPGQGTGEVEAWVGRSSQRSAAIKEVLNESMFTHFGGGMLDADKAKRVYRALDGVIGERSVQKICATTNYDLALEKGFSAIGYRVEDGIGQAQNWAPWTFDASHLGNWEEIGSESVNVLHLHGTVGWYRREDRVMRMPDMEKYNPTLGDPVFLPPDPDKDPLNEAIVQGLWSAFESALEGATHVLVVGHSLHDRTLVAALNRASQHASIVIASRKPTNLNLKLIPKATPAVIEISPEVPPPSWLGSWIDGQDPPAVPRKIERPGTQGQ